MADMTDAEAVARAMRYSDQFLDDYTDLAQAAITCLRSLGIPKPRRSCQLSDDEIRQILATLPKK